MVPKPANEFVASLRAIDVSDRAALILEQIRQELAAIFKTKPELIAPDTRIQKSQSPVGTVASAPVSIVRYAIQRRMGMPIYPIELSSIDTLRALATYLASEIEEPAIRDNCDRTAEPACDWPCQWTPPQPAPGLEGLALILSSPRAGSTLLRVMLQGHPRLFAPPELNLLPFETMGQRAHWFRARECQWLGRGLVDTVAALWNGYRHDARQQIRAWEVADAGVVHVYNWLRVASGEKLLVDKSPLYSLYRDCLIPALACSPTARYIHLVRHPYAVVESVVRMRFHRLYGPGWPGFHKSPWKYAENCWRQSNENILAFLDQAPDSRQRRVQFEDLVASPQVVTSQLCDLLGVGFHPGVLTPYDGNRMTYLRTPTMGDPNFLSHDGIDSDCGNAWTKISLPAPLGQAARALAATLGYALNDR